MGSIEGSPHHSRPHELTFSDRTESESTIKSPFYRPLTPSCLTTLQSCSEPLEYITSPDMSSATKEVAAIEVPAHTRGSSDTLGEIRSDHFDTSTIDSFDTRYVMRSKEKQTLRKSAVDLVCDPLMSSSDNDCKNNLNRNSDTDENKSSLDMASKIDNGIMISEDSDDEGGEFSSTDIDTSSMGSSPCKHIIEEAEEIMEDVCDVTKEAGILITKEFKQGLGELATPEASATFGPTDVIAALLTIAFFNSDLVSDLVLASHLSKEEKEKPWALATLLMAVGPLVIVNFFSMYWYWYDSSPDREVDKTRLPRPRDRRTKKAHKILMWIFRGIIHLLLQAITLRQFDLLYYGTLSLRSGGTNCQRNTKKSDHKSKNYLQPPEKGRMRATVESSDFYEISIGEKEALYPGSPEESRIGGNSTAEDILKFNSAVHVEDAICTADFNKTLKSTNAPSSPRDSVSSCSQNPNNALEDHNGKKPPSTNASRATSIKLWRNSKLFNEEVASYDDATVCEQLSTVADFKVSEAVPSVFTPVPRNCHRPSMCSSSPTIDRWLHAESDAAALDLIGAVLQDVPQIILQLYLLAHILLATSLDQYSSFFGPLSFDTEMTFGSLFLDRKFTDLNTNSFNESKALGYEYFSGDYKVEDFDDLFNLKTMNTSHSTNANQNTDYVLERTLNSSSVNHTTIENAYYSASYSLISNYTLHSLSVNGTESSPITGYLASSKTDEEEKGQLIVPAELQPDTARHLMALQLACILASLSGVSWSASSWVRAVRLASPHLTNLSPAALVFLTVAHLAAVLPQVLCYTALATASPPLLAFTLLMLWTGYTAWILNQLYSWSRRHEEQLAWFPHDVRTGACHRFDDVCLSAALGLVFLFTFVDVGGDATKGQVAIHAAIRVVLQSTVAAVWCVSISGSWWVMYGPPLLVLAAGSTNALLTAAYYTLVHISSQ